MNTGWLCPVCGGGVAPGVERCPCVTLDGPNAPARPTAEFARRISDRDICGGWYSLPEKAADDIPDSLREFVRPDQEFEGGTSGKDVKPDDPRFMGATFSPADDGWIAWHGGERPAIDVEEVVKVRFVDGSEHSGTVYGYDWAHDGADDDIIAYKVLA